MGLQLLPSLLSELILFDLPTPPPPTGCNVTIPAEVVILNSIVLPHKELSRSFKNQIIL